MDQPLLLEESAFGLSRPTEENGIEEEEERFRHTFEPPVLVVAGSGDSCGESGRETPVRGILIQQEGGIPTQDVGESCSSVRNQTQAPRGLLMESGRRRSSAERRVTFVGLDDSSSSSSDDVEEDLEADVERRPRRMMTMPAMGRSALQKKQQKRVAGFSIILAMMLVFVVAAVQLVNSGLFDPDGDNKELPKVANGTATDRKTGVSFELQTVPSGLSKPYDLLGMQARVTDTEGPLCVIGLYIENETEDLDKWKKYVDRRDYESLYEDLLSHNHSMSLRVVFLYNMSGPVLCQKWLEDGVHRHLASLYPFRHALVEKEENIFRSWFDNLMITPNDEIWINWNHLHTSFYYNGNFIPPNAHEMIGHALLENELAARGPNLINLITLLFKL